MAPLQTSARRRLLRFNVLARCAILTQASATVGLGWLSPGSLTARLLETGGPLGMAVLAVMSTLVAIGWVDVLANDVLPSARAWPRRMLRQEHMGYLGLGATYWAQALAGAAHAELGAWVLVGTYVATGGLCCWYGWISAMRGGRSHG